MILVFSIDKEAAGVYVARIELGGSLAAEPSTYSRIEHAIREETLNIPEGFAHFVEFRYGGMSTGTYAVKEAAARAGEMADRLMVLIREAHEISG